ncbi:hypothetical protein [Halalkalibacter okhensis]|uniref:Serine protease n=1 Tax=Halalkalibacter okhensis TaxID=333138 RepID=A0A0B0ICV7_9BACI|nr:hypothetical protein [Halalkalibacter okhensis]KHF37849.1 serine protease [Halalkalibacter okhensis]
MKVVEIQSKIQDLRDQLIFWENHLKDVQSNCDHHFEGESLYQKCTKCQKVVALYY